MRLGQGDISVQYGIWFAVGEDAFARLYCKQRPRADKLSRCGMTLIGVVQVGFDEGRADIGRPGLGHERTNLRLGAVCPDQQIGHDVGAVRKRQPVPPTLQGLNIADLVAPLNDAIGQRFE